MNRSDLLEAANVFAGRESEIRMAVFHCMRLGINSSECRAVWVPMWTEERDRFVDVRAVMRIIETAASIARMKSKWIEEDAKASILRGFPASEWKSGGRDGDVMKMRWDGAGGEFHGPAERMIAPKLDPIWVAISDYGVPWSEPMILGGRDYVMDVSADELSRLNLIYEPRGWVAHSTRMSSGLPGLEPSIKAKLLEELRGLIDGREAIPSPDEMGAKKAWESRKKLLEAGIEDAKARRLKEIESDKKRRGSGRYGRHEREAHLAMLKVQDDIIGRNTAELANRDQNPKNTMEEFLAEKSFRETPLERLAVLKWTGDPLDPKDFEFVDPALPTARV